MAVPKDISPYVLICALCASLNSVILGYDIGVMGGAIYLAKVELALNDEQTEAIMGSLNVVAIFGTIIAGSVSDRFGRTKTIAASSCFFILGGVVMSTASSFAAILIGRMITGVGVGTCFTGCRHDPFSSLVDSHHFGNTYLRYLSSRCLC